MACFREKRDKSYWIDKFETLPPEKGFDSSKDYVLFSACTDNYFP